MAKSKNGGSRAFIRGRIGSDVYSIGKNGKGARQQVVRSLAEQVSNPRTTEQMRGRMIMSTVMQAVSALQPIIDHSFDSVPVGQPSISEFIRRNYSLIKADVTAHPSSGNKFGLNKYQEKGVMAGLYIVSDGSVAKPAAVSAVLTGIEIALSNSTLTVGGLKTALGLSADGYLTFVGIEEGTGVAAYVRAKLSTTLADATAITNDNVASLFTLEGNGTPSVSLSDSTITISPDTAFAGDAIGVIVSEKEDGAWKHSQCVLNGEGDFNSNSSVALPTYPTGSEQFLNGGSL